ncbi:Predicted dithiol-disulfide isomerase, DsbA family [Noviherbaspirillum humi]|uniref:Predicted dithiol-disulfide isomerase, DsbA family n=1 Tax=Noviherbaspirillum humi TaxID=1688639 RepID=A0A239ECT1_9BURK|nr:DsbA family oxidoreductase [Noviherbaspirillum humi]SNS41744.1 Predicted dithiol-disulfide isomerase, DsbA family [Noviherbaspirillum humi]
MPTPSSSAAIRIDVWSDYVCPFCYLELPALNRLQREEGSALEIVWHAFELRPEPKPTLDPHGEYLRTTWARSVYPMAEERGLALKLPPVQPRSRLAFQAVAHAREQGRFDAMHEALFRGFFEQGRDIGRLEVLLELGKEAGVEEAGLRDALEKGTHLQQVLDDERMAHDFGITGVPIMLMRPAGAPWEQSVALRGAVPEAQLRAALAHVRTQGR